MIVTTKDTKKSYKITLRTWDWLVHCSNAQEVWLDVEEVQADA